MNLTQWVDAGTLDLSEFTSSVRKLCKLTELEQQSGQQQQQQQ